MNNRPRIRFAAPPQHIGADAFDYATYRAVVFAAISSVLTPGAVSISLNGDA